MKSHLSPVRGRITSAFEENTMNDTLIFGLSKQKQSIYHEKHNRPSKIKFTLCVGMQNDMFLIVYTPKRLVQYLVKMTTVTQFVVKYFAILPKPA